MTTFSPEQLQEINSIFTSRMDPLKSSIDALKQSMDRQAQESQQAKQPKAPDPDEMTTRQRIEALESRNKQLEEQRSQENLKSALLNGLKAHGIDKNSDLATSFLEKGLHYDKLSGQPYLTIDGVPRPLTDALQQFSQTSHGQFLRDPVDLKGAGQNPNNTLQTRTNTSTNTSVEQKINNGITAKNYLSMDEMREAAKAWVGNGRPL